MVIDQPGKLELVFTPSGGGQKETREVFTFPAEGGCALSMYNTREVFAFICVYLHI